MLSTCCRSRGVLAILLLVASLSVTFGHQSDGGGLHSHEHHHDHHEHDHGHGHDHPQEPSPAFKYSRQANEGAKPPKPLPQQQQGSSSSTRRTMSEVWLEALGATLLISICPFFILFFIPLDNSKEQRPLLKILLSFASGGLLGDAFLHLIPHALLAQQEGSHAEGGGHGHSHGHGAHGHSHGGGDGEVFHHDMSVGLWVLAGIIAFLMVEKFVRIIKGPGAHTHSHSHGAPVAVKKAKKTDVGNKGKKSAKDSDESNNEDNKNDGHKDEDVTGKEKEPLVDDDDDDEELEDGEIKVAGYLNLAADFAHNLTDGLAIGASFLAGKGVGVVTTATVLFHEVPHEIGDFAILVQSGCSRKKAMLLQLVTAFGALTGTLLSLLADGISDSATAWILPFTAGGFIYVATVSVIPELLEGTSLGQSIKEILALMFGVLLMVGIAQYE